MKRRVAIVAVVLLSTACAEEPSPPPLVPVESEAVQHGLRLRLESPNSIVPTEEVIEVVASVTNERGEPVTLWSSSVGAPVAFGVLRLDDGLVVEPDWTDDGLAYDLPAREAVRYPFQKAIVTTSGPDTAFLRAYAADPELHLPPGRWRIEAILHGVLGDDMFGDDDGPSIMAVAIIEVLVTE